MWLINGQSIVIYIIFMGFISQWVLVSAGFELKLTPSVEFL
jgi:hypothetical protein